MSKNLLETARTRFQRAVEAEGENRSRALDAIKFRDLDQWPERVKNARENDPDGARPCLTVDKINQFVRQVSNDERQNRPSIIVRPVDSGADKETAEVFQGLIRHIENSPTSPADIAYDTALEHAADGGFGYFRIVTDYCDETSFQQDILIKRIRNRFSVYLDPAHQMPEASDMNWAFVTDTVAKDDYKDLAQDEWPSAPGDTLKDWFTENGARIAEHFYIVTTSKRILLLEDGRTVFADTWDITDPDNPDFDRTLWVPDGLSGFRRLNSLKEREAKVRRVKWCKLTGTKVLKEQDWAGKYIPILKVSGNEIDVEGKLMLSGLVRPLMDSQRMNNYGASAFVEAVMLAPKSPWVAADGQIEAYETEWAASNRKNVAVLRYSPMDVNGTLVPAPTRQSPPGVPAGWVAMMQQFEAQMEPASGIYRDALGAPSQQKSGVAIQAKQRESDTGTFHYIDNLSRAIRHAGVILVDLIPKIWDAAKVARILGEDGTAQQVVLDPDQQVASREVQDAQGKTKRIYNLGVGRYDVSVSSGPSFATKRQEAAANVTEVIRAYPDIMQIAGDLMFKNMDWPGADEIGKRLQKMLPPQLQEDEEGGELGQAKQIIQQLQGQLQQAAQAVEAMQQEKGQDREIQMAELELKRKELDIKEQELAVKKFEADTDRIRAARDAIQPQGAAP